MRYNAGRMSQTPTIATLIEDLLFRSKVESTAKHLNIAVVTLSGNEPEISGLADRAALVILDLNHKKIDAVEWLKGFKGNPATAKVPVLGFLSHVQVDLKQKAVEARCDLVVPRSIFSAQLPELLSRYTQIRLPSSS